VATGVGAFDLGPPVGASADPTAALVAAAGTVTIAFVQSTKFAGVATLVVTPADAAACLTGGSTIHYTGAVVLEDPELPS
jgi:hypothetical protein